MAAWFLATSGCSTGCRLSVSSCSSLALVELGLLTDAIVWGNDALSLLWDRCKLDWTDFLQSAGCCVVYPAVSLPSNRIRLCRECSVWFLIRARMANSCRQPCLGVIALSPTTGRAIHKVQYFLAQGTNQSFNLRLQGPTALH